MLTLLAELSGHFSPLNIFRYITFRTGGATATALLFVFWFGPAIISLLRLKQGKGQPIRTDGIARHVTEKAGTPTMGGFMILAGLFVAALLWADLRNIHVWVVLLVTGTMTWQTAAAERSAWDVFIWYGGMLRMGELLNNTGSTRVFAEYVAGMFGGTVLASAYTPPAGLEQYVASIAHYLDVAAKENVSVEIQNHPIFDDMPGRLAALAARAPGQPHPFVMGAERYQRFWRIVSECMQADIIRKSAK